MDEIKLYIFMKIILIIIFILILSLVSKKAREEGLRSSHIIASLLLFPFTFFLDYSLQRQEILIDMAAVKTSVAYGFPLALVFLFFLYISSHKKESK